LGGSRVRSLRTIPRRRGASVCGGLEALNAELLGDEEITEREVYGGAGGCGGGLEALNAELLGDDEITDRAVYDPLVGEGAVAGSGGGGGGGGALNGECPVCEEGGEGNVV